MKKTKDNVLESNKPVLKKRKKILIYQTGIKRLDEFIAQTYLQK